jgi:hypothetical protein
MHRRTGATSSYRPQFDEFIHRHLSRRPSSSVTLSLHMPKCLVRRAVVTALVSTSCCQELAPTARPRQLRFGTAAYPPVRRRYALGVGRSTGARRAPARSRSAPGRSAMRSAPARPRTEHEGPRAQPAVLLVARLAGVARPVVRRSGALTRRAAAVATVGRRRRVREGRRGDAEHQPAGQTNGRELTAHTVPPHTRMVLRFFLIAVCRRPLEASVRKMLAKA